MPVEKFSIATIQLAGIICEGILYGSYLVIGWFSARALLFTGGKYGTRLVRWHEVRWLMIIIWTMFFIICTWDMATGILHLFNAFIKSEDSTVEFNKAAGWINISRLLNQSLIILLGDFVGIYRCWIVYERRWLAITPSLILYLGTLATVIRVMDIEITSRPEETFTLTFCPWAATMFGIHAVQNILTSGMLVWRIWCMGRQINKNTIYPDNHKATPPRPIQRLMWAIAESGAVYTTTVFAVFLASALSSNVVYIAVDISLQTAGIVFNVVIICSIGRNRGELCVRVADSENGPTIPVFQHAERDASVE